MLADRLVAWLNRVFPNKAVSNPDLFWRYELENKVDKDNLRANGLGISRDRKVKLVHYIGQLGPGGSERQLCNASVRFREMGFDVRVITVNDLVGDLGHFLPYLNANGIPVKVAEPCNIDDILEKLPDHHKLNISIFRSLPNYLASSVYALVNELISLEPDVLHCWLDPCNIVGGLAGIALCIPRIILGGRNVNPSNFPLIDKPWFRDWYKVLLRSRRVVLTNNSKTGAADYARWLEISPLRIKVIYNGVDFTRFQKVTHEDVSEFRQSLRLDDQTPLVGGVFRLGPEKRPFDFVAVIKRVKKEIPNLKAVVAGVGVLREEVEDAIRKEGLEDTITLLGRRGDVFVVMKSCDLLLHTAENEGSPNILVEAQSMGIPVVGTAVGGIPEIVQKGISGLLHCVGDIESMSNSVIRILCDKAYGKELGEAGKRLMTERFSIDKTANDLSGVYHSKADVRYSYKIDTLYYGLIGFLLPIMRHVKLLRCMPRFTILCTLKRLRVVLNKTISGILTEIRHEQGYCYYALVPDWIVADVNGNLSSLKLFENGIPLSLPHSLHDDIRGLGEGRFSHWLDYVYFSTSDNSDPRTNGKTYSFSE